MTRKTRVREHSRSNAKKVKAHERMLSDDPRDRVAKPTPHLVELRDSVGYLPIVYFTSDADGEDHAVEPFMGFATQEAARQWAVDKIKSLGYSDAAYDVVREDFNQDTSSLVERGDRKGELDDARVRTIVEAATDWSWGIDSAKSVVRKIERETGIKLKPAERRLAVEDVQRYHIELNSDEDDSDE